MRSLVQIIFPSRCIGCSQLGISICSQCRSSWHPHIYLQSIEVNGKNFPILSAIQYSPIASKVLLSAKEGSIRAADELLISSLEHSLSYFRKKYGEATLVPIPSRKSATRKRGRNFLSVICADVASNLSINHLSLLEHTRLVRDQSALNAKERKLNLAGALKVNISGITALQSGNIGPLILVDDLITTGTTLAEAIRALTYAGFTVLGAVTSCAAKPLRLGG